MSVKRFFSMWANRVIALQVLVCLLGIAWGALVEIWGLAFLFLVLLVLGLFLWSEWRFCENDELMRTERDLVEVINKGAQRLEQ